MTQWFVMVGMMIMMATATMAQGVSDSTDLSGDYEEFKRYEAFRKSQQEAIEKQRAAGAKSEFDDFQLFKQYRELRQQSAAQPVSSPLPAGSPAAGTVPASPSPVSSGAFLKPSEDELKEAYQRYQSGTVPASPSPASSGTSLKQAEDDLKEAYKRYQLVKSNEAARSLKVNPESPVSFGWDWVTTLGHTGFSYKNGPVSRDLGGFTVGFGGRFSLPLGSTTRFLLGPEVWYASVTAENQSPVFIHSSDVTTELKQSFLFLRIPVQFQQQMGSFNLAVGAYASCPLMADETKTNFYRFDVKKDLMPYLSEWSFGSTIALTYTLRNVPATSHTIGEVQLGLMAHLPLTGFMKEGTAYQESRMTTYAFQVSARL